MSPFGAKASRAVFLLVAVAGIVPLFCARHLPMADLPEHVAAMATMRHYFDASFRSREYFEIASAHETSYFLYQAIGAALSVVVGSAERANLVLMALVGLGYSFALRELLAALRRDTRLAVLGPALFWTQNLTVGLLNFVASVPFVLLSLAVAVRYVRAPTRPRALALAALSTAILYLHVSSYLLFVAEAIVVVSLAGAGPNVGLRGAVAALPRRAAWLVPSALAAGAVALAGRTGAGDGASPGLRYGSRVALLARIPGWLFDNFRTHVDDAVGMVLVLALVVSAILGTRRGRRSGTRVALPLAMVAVALAFVLAMPSQAGAYAFFLDIRLSVYVAAFALLLPGPSFRRHALPVRAALAAGVVVLVGNVAYEVRAFERDDVGAFDELLQKMPRGARLLSLDYAKYSTRTHASTLHHFGSYYRARYGGIASFSFSEMPHWPVRYRPEWTPPHRMSWGNPATFDAERDGAYFDYVLVHGDARPIEEAAAGPRWEIVGVARGFRLYRKVGVLEARGS